MFNAEEKVIKDNITKPEIEFVEASGDIFFIEYGYDNMDRGFHPILTLMITRLMLKIQRKFSEEILFIMIIQGTMFLQIHLIII